MPYDEAAGSNSFYQVAAVERNFYPATAAEQRASATRGNSSYTAVRPGDRQQRETFGEVVERRDSHGLPGHPACSPTALATFGHSHPTPTTGLRQEQQLQQGQQRYHTSHDSAMFVETRDGRESSLSSQSAVQGESPASRAVCPTQSQFLAVQLGLYSHRVLFCSRVIERIFLKYNGQTNVVSCMIRRVWVK